MLTTIINAFEETLSMVLISGVFTIMFGLPLGIMLFCSNNKQFCANKLLHYILRLPISLLNTTPYLVIMILSIPLFKALSSGNSSTTFAVISLTITTIPLFGSLTFEAINQLPSDLTDTVKTMGATPWQAIGKIILPEILPALIMATAKILIQLISLSTIAGLFGAGGIGALIMQKGYYSFQMSYVFASAIVLVATAQFIQLSSQLLARQLGKQ